jgi:hypothetical protein
MKKKIDMHFHYDPRYSIDEYREYIEPLEQARIVIHAKQLRDKKQDWLNGMIDIMVSCNCRGAIELSISDKGTTFDFKHDRIEIIHSLHSYQYLDEWMAIFEKAITLYDIKYLCHPFYKHLPKDQNVPVLMRERFVDICNSRNIVIELNNRYMRENQACAEFMLYVKKRAKLWMIASDAHEPCKIGDYRNVFSLL